MTLRTHTLCAGLDAAQSSTELSGHLEAAPSDHLTSQHNWFPALEFRHLPKFSGHLFRVSDRLQMHCTSYPWTATLFAM